MTTTYDETFNEWEAANRAIKVGKLIEAIDRQNPIRCTSVALADALENASQVLWGELADIANVNAPSWKAQKQVIASLRIRGRSES